MLKRKVRRGEMIYERKLYSARCDKCGRFFRPMGYPAIKVFEWGSRESLVRILKENGWKYGDLLLCQECAKEEVCQEK